MSQQDILLTTLRKKMKPGQSLIDAIATALNISYDAAHRRVSSKSKFSIDEAVVLCRHYHISVDAILTGGNTLVVGKTQEITSAAEMAQYFTQSAEFLGNYENAENVSLYYAAKDIPLFYTIGGTLLSKFKLYVWMELLIGHNGKSFEQFVFPVNVQAQTEKIRLVYEKASVHEIWNDTTINSTLQQIFYFFESNLLSQNNAVLLLSDLKMLLSKVEEKSAAENKFHLYYNELLILNNNAIVTAADRSTMFIPYTALGYFITEDEQTCRLATDYFLRQMKNSKSLNLSGTRDRKIFFNKAVRKIDLYSERIENAPELLI